MLIVSAVSMIYMEYSGITFNTISLAGIITALGMIVDNSIVVSENIFNYHQRGFIGLEAIKNSVCEVFMPMLVSTLTTVAAFVPMIFVSGTMGRLINQYPKVVIVALITSIFQAVLLLPNNLITKSELKGIYNINNDNDKKDLKIRSISIRINYLIY